MPDIREEFEAWIIAKHRGNDRFLARNDLVYLNQHIQNRWLGWQASRAALLKDHVPMPRQCPSWLEDAYDDKACSDKHYIDGLSLVGYEAMIKAQEEALQQAGIEVVK